MSYPIYGMQFNPFDKQQCKSSDCYLSKDLKEAMSRMKYLENVRGIGVFTAAPGAGKSYALKCYAEQLNPNLFDIKYICLSTVSVQDFYKLLCSELGLSPSGSKAAMFKAIKQQLSYMCNEKRKPLILVIDEAQYLCHGILNDLKMLMNFNYDSTNCMTLMLCGEPVLNDLLSKPVHEALRQRITVHYSFHGLESQETKEYLDHKLKLAGGNINLIDDAAITAMHSHSKGNPRIIDKLMTDALTIGSQNGSKMIDADIMMAAVENQILG